MNDLTLRAGRTALQRIEQSGLTPELVRMMLGASGGPKWLVLSGLDQAVFGEWLKDADHRIDLVGSSIGAWRMAVAAHPEAGQAAQRFLDGYLGYRYAKTDTIQKVTDDSFAMLARMFGPEDKEAIVNNKSRPVHIVAVRGKGIAATDNLFLEAVGFLKAAAANALDRENLKKTFQRVVFHSGDKVALDDQWRDYERLDIPLTKNNLFDALMASGSIPGVVTAIDNIDGAPMGPYRDGGVIDYHFALPWRLEEGVILYPHFYDYLVPGWFDKRLKGRYAGAEILDHMLLIAPSRKFVEGLPGGRISDRKDFKYFSEGERLAFWRGIVDQSRRLGDEFLTLLENHGTLMDRLRSVS